MKMRSSVNLSLIDDERSRRATFRKKKRDMMKSLNELVTHCNAKACAIVYSPYESSPEAWPSREDAKEVISRFMALSMMERANIMVDQEAYMLERIKKEQEQVKKLRDENREFELREFMFECLNGKMNEYHYDVRDVRDLRVFIDRYINELTRRIEVLTMNGESSSFPPTIPLAAADAVADADTTPPAVMVTSPTGFFYDPTQYHNINVNQPEIVQRQNPANFYDHIQYQNMNQQHEPVQYQTPTNNFYDQNQHRMYDHMYSDKNMNLDLNHNLSQNSEEYPNQQQWYMELLRGQNRQMGYVEEHANIPSMDGDHHCRHQPPTVDLATASHIPSNITTTTTADLFASNINNNLWPKRIGLE